MPSSSFVFATAHPSAVPALKAEVARNHPDLRFAYSRPGLVTWKSTKPVDPGFRLKAVFARTSGLSIGRPGSGNPADPAVGAAIAELFASVGARRLHVWARDAGPPDREDPAAVARVEAVRAMVDVPRDDVAEDGDVVLDVIVAADEVWAGAHLAGPGRWPWAGGRMPLEVPAEAPSRAYRKLEEGLAWSRAPMKAGDLALELGSAPGGATLAMLRRGVSVVGVDPEPMDAAVTSFRGKARFTHLRKAMGGVRREELPENVRWLVLDASTAAPIALRAIQRFVPPYRGSLKGALLTLKLNDWRLAEDIPKWLDQVRELGLGDVRATHLPSNGQEIFVAAVHRSA